MSISRELRSKEMDISYQIIFVGNLLALIVAMKGISRMLVSTNIPAAWWGTPKLIPTYRAHTPPMVDLLIRQILFFFLAVITWWGVTLNPNQSGVYLAFPLVWFTTEWLGATFTLLTGTRGLPLIHNSPWLSKSLMDFWGHRWNVWIARWLSHTTRHLLPRSSIIQLWGSFLLSGVLHELMFALPFQLATGRAHYGPMTMYFLLQAFAVTIEKKFHLRKLPNWCLRLWTWAWIIGPIPLFTQGPFLALFRGVI